MISQVHVEEEYKEGSTFKSIHDHVVTTWYWIFGWSWHHVVESYIVDAKAPNLLVNIGDGFLMRFGASVM